MTPAYGLDIETDTEQGGLDPRTSPVVAAAVATQAGAQVLNGPEPTLLRDLDEMIRTLEPGVLVTWNGCGFDLPFLVYRARRCGVTLGLRTTLDPSIRRSHPPLAGHHGSYRGVWHGHAHLDAYLAYRSLVTDRDESLALKAVAARAGLDVIEVDRSRIHELAPTALQRYVANDARLALTLAQTRWRETIAFLDPAPLIPAV